MPRPSSTSRPNPGQVAMQVARDGGPARPETSGGAVPSRGRHRTPDTGEVPASGRGTDGDVSRGGVAPAGARSRHGVTARQAQAVARKATPESMARVEAARAAAARPAAPSRGAGPDAAVRSAPRASTPQPAASRTAASQSPAERTAQPPAERSPMVRPAQPRSATKQSSGPFPTPRSAAPAPRAGTPGGSAPGGTPPEDDAVTDLVAGPSQRGRAAPGDGPGTGRLPGLFGLVLGTLALLGAVIAAAAPDTLLPVIGRLGASPLTLAGLVAAGLLATACAGLGTGRQRRGRGVAVTGMVVGLAAVAAAVVPLLALSSL
jgi:hypothetical protein